MGALEGRYPSGADTGQGRRRRHLTDAIDERLGACENASLHLGLIFFWLFFVDKSCMTAFVGIYYL